MDMDFAMFRQVADNKSDESNVRARFYDKAVKTDKITINGLPIFKNVTYVEIKLKDNSTEVFNQPASAEKIRRFPREYMMYQNAKKQIAQGTPLEQFAFLSAAELETCRSRGIFTVEALAELSAEKVQSLSLQNEHQLANLFLQNAQNNNQIAQFVQKEAEYKTKIEKLQEQINLLNKQLAQINTNSYEQKIQQNKEKNNENNIGNMPRSCRFSCSKKTK